jgi:NitT/TauT family transport system substrate-binding protein
MAIDNILDKLNEEKLSRRTVLKVGIATGVSLAALGVAGCTSPSTTPLVSPTTLATATPAPLKSADASGYLPTDHQAAIFIADAKGLFKKYGLNIQLTKFTAGPAVMTQVSGGTLDLGFAGVAPMISAIDSDPTIKIVASLQGNGSGIIVGTNSGISKVTDLADKKIAIPSVGSIQDIMLRQLFANNGIDYASQNIVAMGAGTMPQSISAGNIDAGFTWEPYVSQAEMNNLANILIRSDAIMPNHPCCAVATTTTMISQYPDTLKAFFQALNDATNYILNSANAQDVAATIAGSAYLNENGAAVEAAAMPNMFFLAKPNETFLSGTETFAKEMYTLGLTKKLHDRTDLYDLTLIDQVIP